MNKEFRRFRTHHARKGSLKDNLKDVFDRSAQCASPEILSHIEASLHPKNRKQRPLPVSVKPLLLYPNLFEFEEPIVEILPDLSPATSDLSTPGSSIPDESEAESEAESDVESDTDSSSDDTSSESSEASEPMEVDSE